MAKTPKKIARRLANRVLADLTRRVDQIDGRSQETDRKVSMLVEKAYNSGIMQVSESEIVAKIFTGLKIYLDPRDMSVAPHMALDGIYESNISNAWISLVQPDSKVADIGANFGYFGALAAQRTDPKNSKVLLFEANPRLIPYINKTLGVNWLRQQSVVENLALSDSRGTLTLNVFKDYTGSSSLHSAKHVDGYMHEKMYVEVEEKVRVKATTLDDYCKQNGVKQLDLIKMDIEGFEENAYDGMKSIVKNSPGLTMFIEFTKQSYKNPKKFYERMLKDFGNIYMIDAEGRLYTPKDKSYEKIIDSSDDWVMPVFSKRNDLAKG